MLKRLLAEAAGVFVALACADIPTAAPPTPEAPLPAGRHDLGVMVVRFSAVGPGHVLSYGTSGSPRVGDGPRLTLTATKEGSTLAGVEAEFLPGAGSFTHGKAGQGGYRYVFGTMKVRNAGVNSAGDTIPYSTSHSNITFVPTASTTGINGTPFSDIRKYDGTLASSSIASTIIPTGASKQTLSGQITSLVPDALQIFTESDVAAISNALPYGYIVRHATLTNSRTLAANPASGQFDGLVTFGIKIPLQLNPADDVYGFTMAFNIMDDNETRITQSVEEQDADGQTAFEARVAAFGNVTGVNVLGGGTYSGFLPVRTLCKVRIAGTAASPTAFISTAAAVTSLSPSPFASPGPAFLARTGTLSATFDNKVSGASSSSFAVNGMESGRAFLSGSFSGNGTTTLTSPAGNYFAGEEVEVALTSKFGCPFVSRLRVATSAATSFGSATNFSVGTTPKTATFGDLDKNGKLDMVVANSASNNISVLLGDGAGSFGSVTNYNVGTTPAAAVLADVNGDGKLDVVVVNTASANVSVLLGTGTGTLGAATNYSVGSNPQAVAVADLNGDGRIDIITANRSTGASVLFGKGDGTFATATDVQVSGTISTNLVALTLADINADGALDLILVNSGENKITVLKGDGAGSFVTPASNFTVGTAPVSAAAGDVDGDGKADLVVANQTTGNVSVLIGNGSGSFGSATNFSVGSFPGGIALGDVNGDGKLDIVTANSGSGNISVRLGTGAGSFGAATNYAASVGIVSIAFGDLNGDGRLDLVAANRQNNNVAVLLGLP